MKIWNSIELDIFHFHMKISSAQTAHFYHQHQMAGTSTSAFRSQWRSSQKSRSFFPTHHCVCVCVCVIRDSCETNNWSNHCKAEKKKKRKRKEKRDVNCCVVCFNFYFFASIFDSWNCTEYNRRLLKCFRGTDCVVFRIIWSIVLCNARLSVTINNQNLVYLILRLLSANEYRTKNGRRKCNRNETTKRRRPQTNDRIKSTKCIRNRR